LEAVTSEAAAAAAADAAPPAEDRRSEKLTAKPRCGSFTSAAVRTAGWRMADLVPAGCVVVGATPPD